MTKEDDNVIDFEHERRRKGKFTKEEARLLKIGNDFDAVITKWLSTKETEVKEIAGVMAHRFGSLLKCIDRKKELWEMCERILKRQADIK